MKTAAAAFIIAVVLVLTGLICLSEAHVTRAMAAEHQRLATLQYGTDDAIAAPAGRGGFALLRPWSSADAAEIQRATLNYWRRRYETLTPLTVPTGEAPARDPNLVLIAANATFRAGIPAGASPGAAAERLSRVIEAYADVLRADPDNLDAAYNYEYVARVRDGVARGRSLTRDSGPPALPTGDDLPPGPTPHGRPGAPPPRVRPGEFKTFVPLQSDERGELMDLDRTPVPRGKG